MSISLSQQAPDETIAAMRRRIYAKDKVTRADFEQALDHDGGSSPEYAQLLCELAIDLMVNQADPPQYIGSSDAVWLIAAIGSRRLPLAVELQLLTQVMQYAVSVPTTLSAFCVAEIEKAVISGGPGHEAGVIEASDTEALRKAVFAADVGQSMHVTRDEAEALFRMAHATAGRVNDPEFDGFFAKAVGNYLMGVAFRGTPSAADELRLEKFENDKPTGLGGFLHSMFGGAPTMPTSLDLESAGEMDDARIEADLDVGARDRAEAEQIDPGETAWLVAHLTREGAPSSPERALLAFLKQEVSNPPSALRALFVNAGV